VRTTAKMRRDPLMVVIAELRRSFGFGHLRRNVSPRGPSHLGAVCVVRGRHRAQRLQHVRGGAFCAARLTSWSRLAGKSALSTDVKTSSVATMSSPSIKGQLDELCPQGLLIVVWAGTGLPVGSRWVTRTATMSAARVPTSQQASTTSG
jgi:hypothetical protein